MRQRRLSVVVVTLIGAVAITLVNDFAQDTKRLGPAANASGTVYYVSPSGWDGSSGTSESEAWRTVAHGLASLSPGDTLYLRGGRYVENIIETTIRPATPSAPTVVRNYPGEQPVIQGLLWLHNSSWWTLDGIGVTWNDANDADQHMVKMINGTGWTVRNSEFWGARSYAALLVVGSSPAEPADWTVRGNCIHDTYATNDENQDQLVYVNAGLTSGRGTIEDNLLFNATNGMGVKLGGPTPTRGGAAHVTVKNNTIHNTSQNVMVAWSSHDNIIEDNIFSKVQDNYSSVRGYQLSGVNNIMRNNLGHEANSILLNDPGYLGVVDGGGNQFPIDPQFDDTSSCAGFRPVNTHATGYGYRR